MFKRALVAIVLVLFTGAACQRKKMRTADVLVDLRSITKQELVGGTVKVESYRVPIDNIRLVKGLNGSTEVSPRLYECPYFADSECAVDLADPSGLQNLLAGYGPNKAPVSEAKTYDGVAVDFCHEHAQSESVQDNYAPVWIKASVVLGSKTYYTNRAQGLSETGPSEEIEIRSKDRSCGIVAQLLTPITLAPETSLHLILFGDVQGALYSQEFAPESHESCVGQGSAFLCSDLVSIFGTIDTQTPKIERYKLEIQGRPSAVVTLMLNPNDKVFGVSLREIGVKPKTVSLGLGEHPLSAVDSGDKGLSLQSKNANHGTVEIVAAFKRAAHNGILKTMDGTQLSYQAVRL